MPDPVVSPGTLTPASAPWLFQPDARRLIDLLGQDQCRFVGGAVRNSLAGEAVNDIDVATRHRPEAVMALAEAAGIKAVPTGIAHGTVTLVINHRPFEVTTLREDVETHGRHATVAFTDDWQADAARRDFTINALYASADGMVHDFFGGQSDLIEGRVRFIGDADMRIEEDALRILRFFRFSARYARQGGLDADGLDACRRAVGRLAILSAERVRAELLRLLAAPDPGWVVAAMEKAGVLSALLPGRMQMTRFLALLALEPSVEQPEPIRRLKALLDATELSAAARALRLSRAEAERLSADVDLEAGLFACLYHHGKTCVRDALYLAAAEGAPKSEDLARLEAMERPELPIRGADLATLGVEPGPAMGALLATLEAEWLAAEGRPDRDVLLARARQLRDSTR